MIELIQSLIVGFIIVVGVGGSLAWFHRHVYNVFTIIGTLFIAGVAILIFVVVGEYTLIILGIHPYPEHWHGCFMALC